MAQEEIIFKVGVDTGDSASRVASIDKEFDTLRKSIKDTEQEVEKLSKEFGANSKEADEAKKKLSNLSQSYKELSKAATDVNAKFEEVYGELQPLTTRLGEAEDRLYELALAGKQNTKEYQDLLETVARYRQTQIETDRVVDSAAQTFTQKLGGAIQAAASGYSAVQGAMGLFGAESEELEKSLLKVQSAMALAQGIEGVRVALPMFQNFTSAIKGGLVNAFKSLTTAEMINATETGSLTLLQKGYSIAVGTSTGAMKAFRIALAATGIGLAIVALGFLVEKMMSYMSSTDDATKAQDRLTASMERFNNEQERTRKNLNDNIKYQVDYAKAVGASDEKIYEIEKNGIKKREGLREGEYYKNLTKIEEFKTRRKNAYNAENEDLANSLGEQIKTLREKNNTLIDEKYALIREDSLLTANYNKSQIDEQKKTNDEASKKRKEEYKRQLEEIHQNNLKKIELENQRIQEQESLENEYYDSLKTKQELEVQAVRDKYFKIIQTTKDNEILLLAQQKELDAIAEKYQEEKDKQENERLDNIANKYEDFVNQYSETVNSSQQNEINAVNEKYFNLIEQAKNYNKEYGSELFNIKELERKQAEELKAIDNEVLNAKKKFVDETSNLLGVLANNAKEGSATQKAFAIAQLAVDTAKSLSATIAGATAAAAATGPAAPFVLGGYIAAGVATVTSALSTANKILKTPMPSVQPPDLNRPTDNTQNDGTQRTQTEIQAQSTYKVVVVDSDITKMQEKTKKTELISTI